MRFNPKIIHLLIVVSLLFFSLAGYLTYFQLFKSEEVAASPYNRRLWKQEDSVMRGTIYDATGEKLAYSEMDGDTQIRKYPYGSLYTHVIGFNSRTYGKSQIELTYNKYLTGDTSLSAVVGLADALSGEKRRGADVYLTIDHALQQKAAALLGKNNGAIVAMNPKTGAVKAMVSTPTFSPSAQDLKANWEGLTEDENSPFLSRATSGLYAPGSTFKTVTACAAIESGLEDETFQDNGSVVIDGKEFKNQGGAKHGKINLTTAFAKSSNVAFATLATEIGSSKMLDAASRFGIGKPISFDVPTMQSRLPENMSEVDTAAMGIGQGRLLVTPLNMAMIASAIANDGKMMEPYLVDHASFQNGIRAYGKNPAAFATPVSIDTARKVQEMMAACVKSGTGTGARVSGLSVYGKTGTAENERGVDHAWFIGYAEDKTGEQLAVAILMEYKGKGGGTVGAPVARDLFATYFKNR